MLNIMYQCRNLFIQVKNLLVMWEVINKIFVRCPLVSYGSLLCVMCVISSQLVNWHEGNTTLEAQHSQALFALTGLTKPKTPVRGNRYHDSADQFSWLSQALCFRLCSHPKVRITCHMTLLLHTKMPISTPDIMHNSDKKLWRTLEK